MDQPALSCCPPDRPFFLSHSVPTCSSGAMLSSSPAIPASSGPRTSCDGASGGCHWRRMSGAFSTPVLFVTRIRPLTAHLSSGFHPQSNGQTERVNQDLETTLRCLVNRNPASWSDQLVWVEYAHSTLTCSSTGLSPLQCAYGYLPPLSCPLAQALIHRCRRTWILARTALSKSADRHTDAANKHCTPTPAYEL